MAASTCTSLNRERMSNQLQSNSLLWTTLMKIKALANSLGSEIQMEYN